MELTLEAAMAQGRMGRAQLAQRLGVSPATIWKWAQLGAYQGTEPSAAQLAALARELRLTDEETAALARWFARRRRS